MNSRAHERTWLSKQFHSSLYEKFYHLWHQKPVEPGHLENIVTTIVVGGATSAEQKAAEERLHISAANLTKINALIRLAYNVGYIALSDKVGRTNDQ